MADAAHKIFKFILPHNGPFVNGSNGAIVVAPNQTDALAIIQEQTKWATPAQWAAATITDLSTTEDAEGFHLIMNVGTVVSCNVTGASGNGINQLCTAAAAALTTAGTFSACSASSNVINIGTADVVGALTITGSITDASGVRITGFDPTINSTGGTAAARSITFPTAFQWPAVVPIKEAIAIPT